MILQKKSVKRRLQPSLPPSSCLKSPKQPWPQRLSQHHQPVAHLAVAVVAVGLAISQSIQGAAVAITAKDL
jgi:hypothetical protein